MNNFSDRVATSIGRHFVMLSCLYRSSTSDKAQVLIFSGFVVDVLGEWFYVTAGHVPKGIGSMIDDGYTFDTWRLNDQAAGKQFEEVAVPFDFQFEHWCVLEDASVGLDYAAVHLGGLYRQQLESVGSSLSQRRHGGTTLLITTTGSSLAYQRSQFLRIPVRSRPKL